MSAIDVLCVGATSYDFVFWADRSPGSDEKTTASAFVRCGGGPAANAAVTVARMGLKAAFAGTLGSDLFGDLHLAELKAADVDIRLVVRGPYATPLSSVVVNAAGERSLVNYRDALPLAAAAVALPVPHPRVLLFDGHEPELSLSLMRDARAAGIPTLLDAGSLHQGTARLFDQVDYLVCSERFAHESTGASSPGKAMESLSSRCRCVVITLGPRGLLWRKGDQAGVLAAFPVEVKDTTGAGDVFHGAFAGSLALGRGWDETLSYASAAAALCCTKLGARTGIPTDGDVRRFLREFSSRNPPA
jgi:sulfofructose kinase